MAIIKSIQYLQRQRKRWEQIVMEFFVVEFLNCFFTLFSPTSLFIVFLIFYSVLPLDFSFRHSIQNGMKSSFFEYDLANISSCFRYSTRIASRVMTFWEWSSWGSSIYLVSKKDERFQQQFIIFDREGQSGRLNLFQHSIFQRFYLWIDKKAFE